MRPPNAARTPWSTALAAALTLGCADLDSLWDRATQPDDAAVDATPAMLAPVALPPDPSVAPRADDDAGASALEPDPEPEPDDAGAAVIDDASTDTATDDAPPTDADADASVEADADADASTEVDASAPPAVTITALGWRTGVVDAPRANARWIGYVRAGGSVAVVRGPVGRAGCAGRRAAAGAGWYEVAGGGYVCVGPLAMLTATALDAALAERLPAAPDLAAAMPFAYARANRSAPVFRRLPTTEDVRAFELGRFNVRPAVAVPPVVGPPRLEDLAGAPGTPLQRRLIPGMNVSLHRQARGPDGATYWHTQTGGYVRASAVTPLPVTERFQGLALDAEHRLPMAFVAGAAASTYRPTGRAMSVVGRVGHHAVIALTDEPSVTIAGETYHRAVDGTFVRARQVRVVQRHDAPADLATPDEKWIDVNLDRQSIVAYEGARPVYVSVVSTGRRNRSNPDENYETVQGGFRIRSKHVATTMDGNSANDGPYSIEDVPWVMYFEGSFALHGAFWHDGFGAMRSHGCVNLSPPDARWFYQWTEPQVPAGWGGVYADPQHPGTRVYVHYDDQALGQRGGPARVPQH